MSRVAATAAQVAALRASSGRVASVRRNTGTITVNSTAWTPLATAAGLPLGSEFDLFLTDCEVGDWVEIGVSNRWGSEATTGGLDFVSLTSAGAVGRCWSSYTVTPAALG